MENSPPPRTQEQVDAFLAGWDAATMIARDAQFMNNMIARAQALREYDPTGQVAIPEDAEPFDGTPTGDFLEAGVEAFKTEGYSETQLPGTGPDGERLI